MNKNGGKIVLNLLLVIIILISAIGILSSVFVGLWLHTYNVFTEKQLVAEITVSPLELTEDNKQFKVEYKQVQGQSAFSALFGVVSTDDAFVESKEYVLNGDEVRLGGQIVKFNDPYYLIGFKTIYKITKIEGGYLDVDEQNTHGVSAVELNGGVDDFFKFMQSNESTFSFIVDTAMGDYPAKNVQQQTVKYGLFVTEEGFLLDRI